MIPELPGRYEKDLIRRLSAIADGIDTATSELESAVIKLKTIGDITEASVFIRDVILKKMAELRVVCDEAETVTAKEFWPFPTYGDLLFGVR